MNNFTKKITLLLIALIIAGCAVNNQQSPVARSAEENATGMMASSILTPVATQKSTRLGTQWGEGKQSSVTTVNLHRSSNIPVDITEIYYSGETNKGRSINEVMVANRRVGMSVTNAQSRNMAFIQSGQKNLLKGKDGERYQLHYRNYSNNIYEIIATVDGLDVINGSSGSLRNRGYVLYPNSTLKIEGFRKSQNEVAVFRFSSASDAYAANTPAGSIKNTGIIGTAIFELYDPTQKTPAKKPIRTKEPQAFPADNRYAPPPRYSK